MQLGIPMRVGASLLANSCHIEPIREQARSHKGPLPQRRGSTSREENLIFFALHSKPGMLTLSGFVRLGAGMDKAVER